MCAREHDRRFFGRGVQADVLVVAPTKFQRDEAGCVIELPEDAAIMADQQFIEALEHLDEVGSLLNPTETQLAALRADAARFAAEVESDSLFGRGLGVKLQDALRVCEALARKFDCVVANPPYMGSSSFSPFMSKWIKKNYPDVKSDLCTCFIERIMGMCKTAAFAGLTTSNSWMFLSSFEVLRQHIVNDLTIETLVQLSVHGFHGIAAQVCTFVLRNSYSDGYLGAYIRLNDFDHHSLQEPKTREAIANPDCGYFYRRNAKTFTQIPGTPIAYWASDALLKDFEVAGELGAYVNMPYGFKTGDNDTFLRLWWECSHGKECYDCQSYEESRTNGIDWFAYNKGGQFRRWYGNNDFVLLFREGGSKVIGRAKEDGRSAAEYAHDLMFKPTVTWSRISSGKLAMRYYPSGFLNDMTGPGYFADEQTLELLQALCNSIIIEVVAELLSPTLDFQPGQISSYPVIEVGEQRQQVAVSVNDCRTLSKLDWDSFETSWDFKRHPLL